jgi:hypothetical protein
MSGMLINLIIQIVAGAIGGNVAGAASKDMSLGTVGNSIAGAIGGGVPCANLSPAPKEIYLPGVTNNNRRRK